MKPEIQLPFLRSGSSKISLNPENLIFLLGGAALVFYSLQRATLLSFTFDESNTAMHVMKHSFWEVISFQFPSANTHLLNSVLSMWFGEVFGYQDWILRLPNVLGHLLYIIFSVKLSRLLFPTTLLRVSAFAVLNLNAWMLDFFALSRGYGLGIAFTLVSVYFLVLHFSKPDQKNLLWSMVMAVLAVLSNFTFIHFFLGIGGSWLLLITLTHPPFKTLWLKQIVPLVAFGVGLGLLIYWPVKQLVVHNQLYWGGKTGFWHDTAASLIRHSAYAQSYAKGFAENVELAVMITCVLMSLAAIFILFRRKEIHQKPFFFVFAILALSVASSLLQHHLAGSKYLMQRTGIMYIPVFMVAVVAFVGWMKDHFTFRCAGCSVVVLALLMGYHFHRSNNHTFVFDWPFDQGTRAMLADLDKEIAKLRFRRPKSDHGHFLVFRTNYQFLPRNKRLRLVGCGLSQWGGRNL